MRRTADRTKFALDAKIALHRLAPAPADAWLPVPPAGSPSSAGQADKRARRRACDIADKEAAGISFGLPLQIWVARRAIAGPPGSRAYAPFGFRGRPAEAPGPRKTRARAAAGPPPSAFRRLGRLTLRGPAR
jgi:hypothetical protein